MHIVGDKTKKMLWRPREIRDKGATEIQHGKHKPGRLDTVDKQQAIWETISEDENRED